MSDKLLRLTVLNGSEIHKPHGATLGNLLGKLSSQSSFFCVELADRAGQPHRTAYLEGPDPHWDTTFELAVNDASVIRITVYFWKDRGTENCGQTSFIVKDAFDGFNNSTETTFTFKTWFHGRKSYLTISTEFLPLNTTEPTKLLPDEDAVADAVESASKTLQTPSSSSFGTTLVDTVTSSATSTALPAVIGCVEKAIKLGDVLAEVHPYAKVAWLVLMSIPKTLIHQLDRDRKIQELWATAADMLSFLQEAQPVIEKSMLPTISAMMKQIYDCAIFVREYSGKGFLGRTLAYSTSLNTETAITSFTSSFQSLKQQFAERSGLETWKLVHAVQDGVVQLGSAIGTIQALEQTKLLSNLPGASLPNVRWDLGNICLPNTRTQLLDDIISWVNSPEDSRRTLWLHGVAGSGKSTVANTVAHIFFNLQRLMASFRFTTQTNDPSQLFGNIVYQMARYSMSLRNEIMNTIDLHGDMSSYPLRNQLKTFIVDTLKLVAFSGPVLIVIDALDEAGSSNDGSPESGERRDEMLEALAAEIPQLPSYVKVLIVSRDEPDIRAHLGSLGQQRSIDNLPDTNLDIRAFFDSRMSQIRQRYPSLDKNWPSETLLIELTERAFGLFQWAAVVCKYVQSFDPPGRLQDILSPRKPNSDGRGPQAEWVLNQLYLNILQKACNDIPPEVFRYVFGSILCSKTPFTQKGLDAFLGLGAAPIVVDAVEIYLSGSESIILALGAILQVESFLSSSNDSRTFIHILHPSLYDFFISPTRCTDTRFYIDNISQNVTIAARCFTVMTSMLKRDICDVQDPTKLNSQVLDLKERIERHIPEHLQYSCRFWVKHLMFDDSEKLFTVAKEWLFEHLLHWLEVMSLLGETDDAFAALKTAETWFKNALKSPAGPVLELLKDSQRFLEYFDSPIRSNAAHIYVSALPFTPSETMLARTFASKISNIPRTISGVSRHWSPCTAIYEDAGRFTVSPDGSHLLTTVSGHDHQLQIRDFITGEPVGVPLVGHTGSITWAQYSNDGKFIMTMASDAMVRVWKASGEAYGVPLGPIEYKDWSIKPSLIILSPDATYIAATAGHSNLQLWDTITGISLAAIDDHCYGTRRGLPSFSPDGKHLLTAWSEVIVIICALRGTVICKHDMETLTGKWRNQKVVFSAKGNRVVCHQRLKSTNQSDTTQVLEPLSGGSEITRVLDPWSGRDIREPLGQGSASFSPDGSCLVFGAHGTSMIQVYDPSTMVAIAQLECCPLYRHSWLGNSLFITHDNKSIYTIDAELGQFLGPPLKSDNAPSATSWSQDGKSIISIYPNKTVCVWNVQKGAFATFGPVPCADTPYNIFISCDLKRFATWNYSIAEVWDFEAFSQGFQGPEARITTVITHWPGPALLILTSEDVGEEVLDPTTDDWVARSVTSFHQVWDQTAGLLVHSMISTHSQKITSIACSADGKHFASASEDGTISVMSLHGDTSFTLTGHTAAVTAISFSSKSGNLASASLDKTIRIWDIETREEARASLNSQCHALSQLAFSEDDTLLVAISSSRREFIYELACDKVRPLSRPSHFDNKLWDLHGLWDFTTWATFLPSPESNILAIQNTGQPHIWATSTGTLLQNPDQLVPQSLISAVAYSADGQQAVCCPKNRSSLQIYDSAANKEIGDPIVLIGDHATFQFSADSQKLATVSDDERIMLCVWDTSTGRLISESKEWYFGSITSFCFSPDGAFICSLDANNEIRLWDAMTGKMIWFQQSGRLEKVCFSQDGTRVVAQSWSTRAKSFDTRTRARLDEVDLISGSFHCYDPETHQLGGQDLMAVSPDGSRQAVIGPISSPFIIDTASLLVTATLETTPINSFWLPQFSQDGKHIAAIIDHGKISVWDATTGNHLSQPFDYDDCFAIRSFTFASPTQISFTYLKEVNLYQHHYLDDPVHFGIWDFMTGLSGPNPFEETRLWDPALSPDGKYLLMHDGSRRRGVTVWDTSSGTEILTLGMSQVFNLHARFTAWNVAFSPDGTKFAHVEGAIHVWDLTSGNSLTCIEALQGYTGWAGSIQFSPDSSKVMCVTGDRMIAVWDISQLPDAANVIYNYPDHLPLTKQSLTDNLGWFRGPDGKRLLWIPKAFRRDYHQGWVAEREGKLTIVEKGQDPLFVDASDYLNSFETVKKGWRNGTVSARTFGSRAEPNQLLGRAFIDNNLETGVF
ncbi:hypothetical protein C8J56DRAFT_952444 [Mycena floridula]|nr:hypothetical protein C8J56DRAFT_952444 [Mycena floridula]